jgi:hypothetical protein
MRLSARRDVSLFWKRCIIQTDLLSAQIHTGQSMPVVALLPRRPEYFPTLPIPCRAFYDPRLGQSSWLPRQTRERRRSAPGPRRIKPGKASMNLITTAMADTINPASAQVLVGLAARPSAIRAAA